MLTGHVGTGPEDGFDGFDGFEGSDGVEGVDGLDGVGGTTTGGGGGGVTHADPFQTWPVVQTIQVTPLKYELGGQVATQFPL